MIWGSCFEMMASTWYRFPMKTIVIAALLFCLAGCAKMHFAPYGKEAYSLRKNSDACAIGSPDSVKEDLRMEAVKFCAARREVPVEIESTGEYGIPYLRCASAGLIFKCAPPDVGGQ